MATRFTNKSGKQFGEKVKGGGGVPMCGDQEEGKQYAREERAYEHPWKKQVLRMALCSKSGSISRSEQLEKYAHAAEQDSGKKTR